jgi:trans-2,3-dihydro-3-hydroxyanthranilate isomerase
MKEYSFLQVDAFTSNKFSGNPCAVFFDTEDLSAKIMLKIAGEMNLAECAFLRSSDVADFGARYFTPAEEIPLAGHPTIASVFSLIETGRLKVIEGSNKISLELPAAVIEIEIEVVDNKISSIVMTQPAPKFLNKYPAEEIVSIFGLDTQDVLENVPIQIVSTGTPFLLIPLKSQQALQKAALDFEKYRAFKVKDDFFDVHLFVLQGVEKGDTFARMLSLPPEPPEDPFTGSATGCMASYLWHYGLIESPSFLAEQGHWIGRPGIANVEVLGPPNAITGVKVGGQAVKVIEGIIELYG